MSKERKGLRINGLANIGMMMSRVAPSNGEPAPRKNTKEAIISKTLASLKSADSHDTATIHSDVKLHNLSVVTAAVREGYNLGHAEGTAQTGEIERLIEKRFSDKTALTMPTIVAAIMEQIGMTELVLDLAAVQTVFERTNIDFRIHDEADGNLIEYKLRHKADDEGAGDSSFALKP